MGLFDFLFGPKRQNFQTGGTLNGTGEYDFDIVGESHYKDALQRIAGKKTEERMAVEKSAVVVHEPSNPHDRNAVMVLIDGYVVGYFSRDSARRHLRKLKMLGISSTTPLSANAMIVGGWKDRHSEGSYGVKLDIQLSDE